MSLDWESLPEAYHSESNESAPPSPRFDIDTLTEQKSAKKEGVGLAAMDERLALQDEIDTMYMTLGSRLTEIYEQVGNPPYEFPTGVLLIRDAVVNGSVNEDEFYLALQVSYEQQEECSTFQEYISTFIENVERMMDHAAEYPDQEDSALDNLKFFQEILGIIETRYIYGFTKEDLFSSSADEFIETVSPDIDRLSAGLYTRLGLDGSKIKRDPRVFLEMAMRREQNIHNIIDVIQEKLGRFGSSSWSIGPLEIRPETYVETILKKNGASLKSESYRHRVEDAKKGGLIEGEQDIYDTLMDPHQAAEAYVDILAMYIPNPGKPISILLDKGDGRGRRPYTLPLQNEYVFSDRAGNAVTFSHEEMRLAEGLAKYQGVGLTLTSKDVDASTTGDQIDNTNLLVLNNRVTFIAAGIE